MSEIFTSLDAARVMIPGQYEIPNAGPYVVRTFRTERDLIYESIRLMWFPSMDLVLTPNSRPFCADAR